MSIRMPHLLLITVVLIVLFWGEVKEIAVFLYHKF